MKKEQLAFKNQKCALWPVKYGIGCSKVCARLVEQNESEAEK